MAAVASRLAENAQATSTRSPSKRGGRKTIAMAAPNVAAEAMPSVNGLASGFRSTPCIIAPAIPSPNPAAMAKRIRCRRYSQTIVVARGVLSTRDGKRRAKIAAYTSSIVRSADPRVVAIPMSARIRMQHPARKK